MQVANFKITLHQKEGLIYLISLFINVLALYYSIRLQILQNVGDKFVVLFSPGIDNNFVLAIFSFTFAHEEEILVLFHDISK